jgi:hypothetical protein
MSHCQVSYSTPGWVQSKVWRLVGCIPVGNAPILDRRAMGPEVENRVPGLTDVPGTRQSAAMLASRGLRIVPEPDAFNPV